MMEVEKAGARNRGLVSLPPACPLPSPSSNSPVRRHDGNAGQDLAASVPLGAGLGFGGHGGAGAVEGQATPAADVSRG